MKNILSVKKVTVSFLIIILALVAVYQQNLMRLYTAVTLYDQDKIANNFLTMYQSFNATVIPASTQPFYFPFEAQPLPDSFEYDNSAISTQSFIEYNQTTSILFIKDGKIVDEDTLLSQHQ